MLCPRTSNIAFAVNLMSGMVTAFAGMFVLLSTMYLGKLSLVGRDESTNSNQNIALLLSGLAAGLSATFCVSVWFSAMEGGVCHVYLLYGTYHVGIIKMVLPS
ncbi:MAG: DUF2723 domain-containing protein [Saprospiraceae bacterium]|nr:DUF2723 domain-containing protein [Candidatus Brachybacter algidus]